MERYPEWLRRVAFGSAYGKDKVSRLQRLFEFDEKMTNCMQLSFWYIPRSYIDKEFPEYKSIFDFFEKLVKKDGGLHKIMVGSFVEGAWSCRLLKDPRCMCSIIIK